MTYKRISSEEAARLCLAGSEKVRFCPGYPDGLPKLKLDQSATVSMFLDGSGYEFYIEQKPKRLEFVSVVEQLNNATWRVRELEGRICRSFDSGTKVQVTIEEIV